MQHVESVLERVRRAGVLAVLRAPDPDTALAACAALIEGGVTGLEITFSTPDAPAVIREARLRHPEAVVGAGTVLSAAQTDAAVAAGAEFLVSPGTDPEVLAHMLATGAAVMAGALTPTEVMQAVKLGTHVVKVFPASLGGPGYLAALRAPFPDFPFMPTGGVSPDNVADWVRAGAVAVGAGGDLVPGKALAAGDYAAVTARAVQFATAWREALA